jgi:hypothetical protein
MYVIRLKNFASIARYGIDDVRSVPDQVEVTIARPQ